MKSFQEQLYLFPKLSPSSEFDTCQYIQYDSSLNLWTTSTSAEVQKINVVTVVEKHMYSFHTATNNRSISKYDASSNT